MKKALIQLGHWILKNKKSLIYGALALFVVVCFFGIGGIGIENQVFAAGDTPDQSAEFERIVTEKKDLFDFFQKAVYVLIYPLLFLAGKLVDNSLVYGEIFGFDAVLWNLWVIVRNLANFGLGFIFIYKIFKILTSKKQGDDIKKLLVSSLIAGVSIQASWFIMAALVDVSTILTYGIGGLPISVLGGGSMADKESYDPHVLKTVVPVDVKDIGSTTTYLTNFNVSGGSVSKNFYISECKTFPYKYISQTNDREYTETLILAPSMIYYKDENNGVYKTDSNRCHYFGQVYYFSSLYDGINRKTCDTTGTCVTEQANYNNDITNSITQLTSSGDNFVLMNSYIKNGQILQPWNGVNSDGGLGGDGKLPEKVGLDADNDRISDSETSRLSNLLDGKSYVGVFTSLYTSLLNAGRGAFISSDNNTYVQFLSALLSFGHAMALIIPLAIVALVLMMRIGIIWIAIALSPLIALLSAFKSKDDKSLMDSLTGDIKFLEYFKIENLIRIIMSPAVICFAISLSAVLVRVIQRLTTIDINTNKTRILGGLIQLDIAGFGVGLGQLIVAIMGIAVTWFLVRAAIGASKLGQTQFMQTIKKDITKSLGNIPIVPIVGKDGVGQLVGVNTIKNVYDDRKTKMERDIYSRDTSAIEEMWNPEAAASEAAKNKAAYESSIISGYVNSLIAGGASSIEGSWSNKEFDVEAGGETVKVKFNNLTNEQKDKIIADINQISDENVRRSLGKAEKEINVGTSKYTFNDENLQYENK